MNLVETRDIFEENGRFYMSLTAEELNTIMLRAPESIVYFEGIACTEVVLNSYSKEPD